jgi:VCBS repeat-containing protein
VIGTGPTSGSLALNANGSFTYTPNANFNGSDSFTYRANDGTVSSNLATVTITVNPVNDAPVANNDTYATNQNSALTITAPGVLANDTDVDGNTLTAVPGTGPASGVLSLNSNGSFTYTPNANFSGTDSFTYRANDGTASSNLATVTITVNSVNSAPVANNDTYPVNEDGSLNISAPGVLANDTDVDGNTLTAVLGTGPASGVLALNLNGSFTYTPNANFNGTDSFTYRANDGTVNSNLATVTITVNPVNDAPVANNDAYTVNEDGTLNIAAPGVLANDTDVDGNPLTELIGTGPSSGSLTLNANGSFTYTPNANFNGTDSFTYRANDGTTNSNLATVAITVNPVNDAPVANNDAYTVNEDGTLNIAAPGVLSNDTDVDGNPLTAVIGTGPSSGTLTLNPNGSFTYTPNANFNGTDSFTYRANDGTTNSNAATVTITVNPVNDAPVAKNDTYTVNEDGVLNIAAPGVLANDTDVDGNPLTAVIGTGPSSGTLTLNPNGSFTYTPNANFNGTDSFTYRANDGTTSSSAATVTITVNPVNDAPVANSDTYTVSENGTLSIAAPGVLANDTDVDGNPLTAVIGTGPSSGSLTLNANGSFTYTPNANFIGTDSFTYRANDGTANSNIATVTLTVIAASNTPPVATDDCYTTNEDTPLTVTLPGLLANDSDADGNPLTAVLVSGPSHGTLTLNANGSFTFTPNANFNGNDTFTYRANDGTANSNLATVMITICPINDAPVANSDSYITNQNTPLTVTIPGVLANDTDAEGTALTAVLNSGPSHGTVTLNANGSFTYTAVTGYTGNDSFTYRASDGTTTSSIATVTIAVNPVANPLVTAPASITIAATSAGGATAATSQLLAAFLAAGSAVDSTDPAPVRLTPQINGVDVTSATQFGIGTSAVTFRYRDASGQIGTATSYVNVIVGSVSISNSITGKGVDVSGNYYVDLKLTNTGTGNAFNLAITESAFRTLTGTGSVSLLNPGTIAVGNLEAGASTTIRILLNRPVTVKRFSFTQTMTFNDVTGVNFSASAAQTIIP